MTCGVHTIQVRGKYHTATHQGGPTVPVTRPNLDLGIEIKDTFQDVNQRLGHCRRGRRSGSCCGLLWRMAPQRELSRVTSKGGCHVPSIKQVLAMCSLWECCAEGRWSD